MQYHRVNTLLILIIAAILVVPVLQTGSTERAPDHTTIDPALFERISTLEAEDRLELIIQFEDEVTSQDHRELDRLGFETLLTYHVVPAVYAIGTVEGILALSGYHRTHWIEYNQQNELYLQETTSNIGANQVWTSVVVGDTEADMAFDTQSQLSGIDGSGVTIAVVDTGVDGQHPDLDYGEKLVMNKHKNGPNDPWVEMENTDTSYGHGTHCAGITAGNGDASAGQRRGVAPGANLIGVGGDWTPVYWAVLDGLEWVYDNSKPGNNLYNIRVVSNSWGGEGDYDPEDAITVITTKLMRDNNVVCVFAAGNAGEGDHDGATDTTGQQSKIPAVVSVAATTHDVQGMAVFSSRGKDGDWITYPDIAAPGVDIWATRPRYTWLGEYQLIDEDMYYMAISGTSMATPHVSGLVALMFEAAPSLRVSDHTEDDNAEDGTWSDGHDPYIHEVEYILKMTSDMIESTGGNGVPEGNDTGLGGRDFDFAQGYGLVNSQRAVAVCLILEKLRMDDPGATVDDALDQLNGVITTRTIKENTDTLTTSWRGEWAQLTNGSNPLSDTTFATDQHHRIFIPEDSTFLSFNLNYNPLDLSTGTGGTIDATLDWDGDGNNDLMPVGGDAQGQKHYDIDLTQSPQSDHRGKYWVFNVEGEGFKAPITNPDDEFHEALIEYTFELWLIMMPDSKLTLDDTEYLVDASPWRFSQPSPAYNGATISLTKDAFKISNVKPEESFFEENAGSVSAFIIGFVVLLLGIFLFIKQHQTEEEQIDQFGTPDNGEEPMAVSWTDDQGENIDRIESGEEDRGEVENQ